MEDIQTLTREKIKLEEPGMYDVLLPFGIIKLKIFKYVL